MTGKQHTVTSQVLSISLHWHLYPQQKSGKVKVDFKPDPYFYMICKVAQIFHDLLVNFIYKGHKFTYLCWQLFRIFKYHHQE